MSATRVLIVDSHPIVADSLSSSLEEQDAFVTMACPTYKEVPACIDTFHPQIIVINMHQGSEAEGLEACRQIAALPADQMIVLIAPRSLVEGEMFSLDAVEAGADGVLVAEDLDLSKLVRALEDLEAGRSLLDPKQLREALALRRAAPPPSAPDMPALANLTLREQEIADLILLGCATSEIAERLTISERTVQNHISNILTKLNVRTRAEAVARLYMWRHAKIQDQQDVTPQ